MWSADGTRGFGGGCGGNSILSFALQVIRTVTWFGYRADPVVRGSNRRLNLEDATTHERQRDDLDDSFFFPLQCFVLVVLLRAPVL
jgi:hypothetical protein